jgi:hypothetical protein
MMEASSLDGVLSLAAKAGTFLNGMVAACSNHEWEPGISMCQSTPPRGLAIRALADAAGKERERIVK